MLRVFTAFSGYDSQCLALNRLGLDYDLVGWSEIDKFAIKAHDALFPQYSDRNYGDISQIDWNKAPDFDLFTYSSPCQDFSNAGKMRGGDKGSGTRSSLLWECQKAIYIKRPRYLLMENVSNLVSKRFINTFNQWLKVLEDMGYTNYWQVLNAKDYSVPQNRKRVFVVSVLYNIHPFVFPEKIELTKRLKDVLEDSVDERYYLREKRLSGFNYGLSLNKTTVNKCDGQRIAEPIVLGWTRDANGNVVDRHPVEIANCITSAKRDNTQNYVVVPANTKSVQSYRIRKLTERECFRLMGVHDKDSDKIRSVVSKSQCYKLAGNGIVVDVLEAIFRELLTKYEIPKFKQLKLFRCGCKGGEAQHKSS